jgi:hypothetical protein
LVIASRDTGRTTATEDTAWTVPARSGFQPHYRRWAIGPVPPPPQAVTARPAHLLCMPTLRSPGPPSAPQGMIRTALWLAGDGSRPLADRRAEQQI